MLIGLKTAKEVIMAIWPSGLRRQLQALVRKGESSNPSVVIFLVCVI